MAWHDGFILTDDARLNQQFISFFRLVTGLRLCDLASPEIHEQFVRLADFLPGHFRYEEEVMHSLRYPERMRHAEIHDFLSREIAAVIEADVPALYLGKVQACLISCLENHLYIEDPEFIAHVADEDELFER